MFKAWIENKLLDNRVAKIYLRWLFLSLVAAAPSFVIAVQTKWNTPLQMVAMGLGVVTFSILLTAIELYMKSINITLSTEVSKSIRYAYIARLGMSVLFPIGMVADTLCGAVTIFLIESQTSYPYDFVTTYIATLVQGVLMNIVIVMLAGGIWALRWLWLNVVRSDVWQHI